MTSAAFRCPTCASSGTLHDATFVCGRGHEFSAAEGIVDFLVTPTVDVVQELRGLAAENGVDIADGDLAPIKRLAVDTLQTQAELLDVSRHDRNQYYQQNIAAFFEALSRAKPDAHMKVLEIGADRTLFKLRTISDLWTEAYGVNVFFHVPEEGFADTDPVRVLADMNALPFVDEYFDLVICSAVLHHSADLGGTLGEISRVLRPGGRVVVINEPVEGRLKAMGRRKGAAPSGHHHASHDDHDGHDHGAHEGHDHGAHDAAGPDHSRHDDIHELPVTYKQWYDGAKRAGLRADPFLPSWFVAQVQDAKNLPEGVRFGGLAKVLSRVVDGPARGDVLRALGRAPGQAVLGLPYNCVLWKAS